jgi:Type I restriction modification DNA specificity domain
MLQVLSHIAQLQAGYQSPNEFTYTTEGTHTLLQASHLNGGVVTVPADGRQFNPQRNPLPYLVQQGDVLLLTKGHRFDAGLVKHQPQYPTVAGGLLMILRVRSTNSIDPAFLCWHLNQPKTQLYLKASAKGSAIPYINREAIEKLEVPILSLPKQHLILKAQMHLDHLVQLENSLHEQRCIQLQHLSLTQEISP